MRLFVGDDPLAGLQHERAVGFDVDDLGLHAEGEAVLAVDGGSPL
jgi:hypothetical protein